MYLIAVLSTSWPVLIDFCVACCLSAGMRITYCDCHASPLLDMEWPVRVLETDSKCNRFDCCLYRLITTLLRLAFGDRNNELTSCMNTALRPANMTSVCKLSDSCYSTQKMEWNDKCGKNGYKQW